MDNVPAHLEQKYVPRLKDQFRKFADMVEAVEMDPSLIEDPSFINKKDVFLGEMDELYADFEKDGGTKEQWNTLAPAVHYGKFGPY